MSAGSIVVKLDLDGDRFTAKLSGATADLSQFSKALGITDSSLKSSERHVTSWGRRFRDTVIVIGLARHALLNLNDIVLGLPRSIIRANAELEKMNMLMVGLSKDTGGFEAVSAAADRSVDYIFQLARTAPFQVDAITDSFVKLNASGIDPAAGGLEALINSVARFGGTSENLKRASIAIQQMSGKGVISMEELRQQLGEAVPNAVMVMSRALNLTMGDLVNKISQGVVQAESALKAMFRQMELENSGSALRMANTWDGIANRMKTRFITLAKEIGDAGFYDEAKDSLRALTDEFLTSGEVIQMARDLGQMLGELIRFLRDMAVAFQDNIEIIKELSSFIVKLKLASIAYSVTVKALTIGQKAWTVAAEIAAARAKILQAQMHAVTVSGIQGAGAAFAHARATQQLAGAMAAAGTSASLLRGGLSNVINSLKTFNGASVAVTLALWGMYEIWQRFIKEGPAFSETIEEFNAELAGSKAIEQFTAQVREQQRELDSLIRQRDRLMQKGGGVDAEAHRKRMLEEGQFEERIMAQRRELELANEKLHQANMNFARSEAQKEFQKQLHEFSTQNIEIQAKYERDLLAARDAIFADDSLSQQRKTELLNEAKLGLDNANIDAKVALVREAMDRIFTAIEEEQAGANDSRRLATLGGIRINLEEEIEQLERLRVAVGGLVEVKGSNQSELTPFDRWVISITKKIDTVTGKVKEASPELENFMTMLERGDFGELSPEQQAEKIAQAQRLTEWLEKQRSIYEIQGEAVRTVRRESKNVLDIQAELTKRLKDLNTDNPFMKAEVDVENFRQRLESTMIELQLIQDEGLAAGRAFDQDLADGIAAAAEQMARLGSIQVAGPVAAMRQEVDQISLDLLTERERVEEMYRRQLAYLEEIKQRDAARWSTEQLAIYEQYVEAINDKFLRDSETPIERLLREWSYSTDRMLDVWATAMEGFSESLTNALVDGEGKFKDFATSILKMILKIQLQKMIAGIADIAISSFGFGAPSAPPGKVNLSGGSTTGFTSFFDSFANGGIMTNRGKVALRKYARGGIADRPQVALFGEGAQPEAYVPLPDGRRIPVNINHSGDADARANVHNEINVINQTSIPVTAEKGQTRFDGEKYVIDVVLRAAGRPGPLRDVLKGTS